MPTVFDYTLKATQPNFYSPDLSLTLAWLRDLAVCACLGEKSPTCLLRQSFVEGLFMGSEIDMRVHRLHWFQTQ